jgi:hypothetical protein
MRSILLYELNEVPPRVLDSYLRQRPDSTLSKLTSRSRTFTTICEDQGRLDPWISWPTLHRGVTNAVHEIEHLGQPTERTDENWPPIWSILSRAGIRTGVFGSLFSAPDGAESDEFAFYMPDYFASRNGGEPDSFRRFHAFNTALTRESGLTVSTRFPVERALEFAFYAPSWGIRPRTLAQIAHQLAAERLKADRKTHRRSLQTVLMFDVFEKALRRTRPQFATFYTNNVAAAMHRFWAAAYPEDYPSHPFGPDWVKRFRNEILDAMDYADATLSRLHRFVDQNPEYILIVASSLGQGAIPAQPRNAVFSIRDLDRFMAALGLGAEAWEEQPAMVPCRAVKVSPGRAGDVRSRLLTISMDGHDMEAKRGYAAPFGFDQREDGYFHIHVQFFDYGGQRQVRIGNREYAAEEVGLGDIPTDFSVANTAQHVPEGSLIIYDPLAGGAPEAGPAEVSTVDIAPSILSAFGIEAPGYMKGRNLRL